MAREVEHCESCGAKIVEYKHTMNKGLVAGLRKLLAAGGGPIHLDDLGLTYNQRCNFQKLRYWGFVKRAVDQGCWEIERRGRGFLLGFPAARAVWTYRGDLVRTDPASVWAKDVDPQYEQRADYAKNAKPHLEEL